MKEIFAASAIFLASLAVEASAVTVAWDPNPPAENVVAYRVAECAQGTTDCRVLVEVTGMQATIEQAVSVSRCYRVLAVNQYGLMSDWSTEVCAQFTKPSAVNAWRVILYVPRAQ